MSAVESRPADSPPRVCVIGGGPAGFFTAHQLLKIHPTVEVDVVEGLPVPYGLVRFGVAPDHPEVKNVTETFDGVAASSRCNYYGNLSLGRDFGLAQVRDKYSATVLSYGCAADRELGVPGEDLPGVLSARAFVNWYNGHPDMYGATSGLTADHVAAMLSAGPDAVVFGHGNVALDVARVLLAPIDHLASTDITSAALDALASSTIERVHVIGRRGPIEVAFTIKELRELTKLEGCLPSITPASVAFSDDEQEFVLGDRRKKRLVGLMEKIAATDRRSDSGGTHFVFHRSPTAIVPTEGVAGGSGVAGVQLEVNTLDGSLGSRRAIGTGTFETLPCSVVFRSIGYKAVAIDPDVPFDARAAVIPNTAGRVSGADGLYCAGWIKTGPSGVIATTMSNAYETARTVAADLDAAVIGGTPCTDGATVREFFASLGSRVVTFKGWKAIEAAELAEGAKRGKTAEKITSVDAMIATAASAGGVL